MRQVVTFTFFFLAFVVYSQQNDSTDIPEKDKYVHLFTDIEEPLVELGREEEQKDFKKKKPKKRVFYGIKTKRAFIKSGYGPSMKIEVFHYMKVWEEPTPYAKYIYWFDWEKWKIMKTPPAKVEQEKAMILHGPYKIMMGSQEVLEEGIYYKGTKHGRWMTYSKPKDVEFKGKDTVTVYGQQQLNDKEKWYKGWPKEAEISYYDREKTKFKEVLPYVNGVLEGDYFRWFENGKIEEYGVYEYGQKVGRWTEYHNSKKRHYKKKEIDYPKDPFEKEGREGVLINEWDEDGKLIFGEEENKLQRRN